MQEKILTLGVIPVLCDYLLLLNKVKFRFKPHFSKEK